jgi:hypothetical protein
MGDMASVFRCSGCRCDLMEAADAPILRDEVWAKLAGTNEHLCQKCFYDRSIARKVPIYLAQLKPCVFNLLHTPRSWFDLFLGFDETPPSQELIEEWRAAIVEFGGAEMVKGAVRNKLPAILVDPKTSSRS